MAFCLPLFANHYIEKIEGIVLDAETGKEIIQANVVIVGTDFGTVSDNDGKFKLENQFSFPMRLEISHVGYLSHIEIIDQLPIDNILIRLYRQSVQMDEVVVTGTRTQKFRNETPIATEVITKNDIENSGARNVADLLSQRAGVSLQTSVAGGSNLNILGMDSKYILILIDGQPITGKFNNRVSLDQILTAPLEKIEIVKGPNSSLYGSEAMGGIINIITDKNKNNRQVNVSARYGNTQNNFKDNGIKNGSNNLGLNIIQPLRDLLLDVNVNVDEIQKDKSVQQIDIDKVRRVVFEADASWKLNNENKVSIKTSSYDQVDSGSSKLMNTNTDIDRKNFSLLHKTNYQKRWNVNQTIISNNYSRNYVQERPWGELEKDDLTSEKHLEYEILLNKQTESKELNAGLEVYRANYSSDRISSGEQEIISKSIFGQYDIKIKNQLNMIFGLRFDDYNNNYRVSSPRIGLLYGLTDKYKFRMSWGRGFRAPSFMERFIDWNNVQFNYLIEGNPDLVPERSNGITIGMDYFRSRKSQLSLSFYSTRFDNLIQDYVKRPGVLSYQNIFDATFTGIELVYDWTFSKRLDSKWILNWVDNRDADNNPIPNTIPFSISNLINFNFLNNFVKSSINAKWVAPYKPQEYDVQKGIYILAEEKMNAYTLINIRTSIKLNDSINISLVLDNVGNYTNTDFGPFIGRAAYLELSSTIIR